MTPSQAVFELARLCLVIAGLLACFAARDWIRVGRELDKDRESRTGPRNRRSKPGWMR